jgi:hypothetical protein
MLDMGERNALNRVPGMSQQWPTPEYDEDDQPHFLFIVTPPFSGSTALSELINSSPRTMLLQARGEGQWLVPGMCEADRWKPDKHINYESVKAVWLKRYQEAKQRDEDIEVVIEKSPPNMVRIEKLSSEFRNFSLLASNRNPYANCSSILYRNHPADALSTEKRQGILKSIAESWLARGRKIEGLMRKLDMPLITYERFCDDPSLIKTKLRLPKAVTETIDPLATVKVKDYPVQPIANQNDRQIAKLSDAELASISTKLEPHDNLLAFFGYNILQP